MVLVSRPSAATLQRQASSWSKLEVGLALGALPDGGPRCRRCLLAWAAEWRALVCRRAFLPVFLSYFTFWGGAPPVPFRLIVSFQRRSPSCPVPPIEQAAPCCSRWSACTSRVRGSAPSRSRSSAASRSYSPPSREPPSRSSPTAPASTDSCAPFCSNRKYVNRIDLLLI